VKCMLETRAGLPFFRKSGGLRFGIPSRGCWTNRQGRNHGIVASINKSNSAGRRNAIGTSPNKEIEVWGNEALRRPTSDEQLSVDTVCCRHVTKAWLKVQTPLCNVILCVHVSITYSSGYKNKAEE